jgi:hypothetical protein
MLMTAYWSLLMNLCQQLTLYVREPANLCLRLTAILAKLCQLLTLSTRQLIGLYFNVPLSTINALF